MAVIRPFGLNDILLLLGLQHNSVTLAIEHILTHPRAPLWTALTAPWPWAGVGVATYVLIENREDGPMTGFVQLMKRAARPEADILHLAPALLTVENSEAAWDRLLSHCTPAAASHGLQRVFASIPDGGPEEARLKEAGFSLYTRETIYRLAVVPASGGTGRVAPERGAGLRPQLPQDSWALQRLYTGGTPRLVQLSEGAITGEVGSPPLSWWEPDSWQGIVWEPAGEIRGAVQVHIGRAGHWVRIWGINTLTAREMRSLVAQGLHAVTAASRGVPTSFRGEVPAPFRGRGKPLPVYVTVRDYEMGIGAILTGFGFAPYINRARFVKHTGATVRRPVSATATARSVEARQELRPVRQ